VTIVGIYSEGNAVNIDFCLLQDVAKKWGSRIEDEKGKGRNQNQGEDGNGKRFASEKRGATAIVDVIENEE